VNTHKYLYACMHIFGHSKSEQVGFNVLTHHW
jgi:hypothetical protein